MKLSILSSSSAGNCYVLHNDNEALIIECGVRLSEIKKALDYNIAKIVGCIVTHEHNDHAGYMSELINSCIPVYCSRGTADAKQLLSERGLNIVQPKSAVMIGNFKVMPFDVQHDCAEPLGYLINHTETGNVLFATDTFYLKYKFRELNNILIECNYSEDILYQNVDDGKLPYTVQQRVSGSHMSCETCLTTLQANDLSRVNNIVLIHLSSGNSNAEQFRQGITQATGKNVKIAEKGLILDFNKLPF